MPPRSLIILAASLLLSSSTAASATPAAAACEALKSAFPNHTYFPGTPSYETENTDFWSTSAVLSPACIFTPLSATDAAHAVRTLAAHTAPFAVKGGGGMTIDGYASIGRGGILLSTANLTGVDVAPDASLVAFGAGENWDAVYLALKPHGRAVVGGRMGLVGVAGFLLGGGVGFLSNQYGFASTSVVEYECILANGTLTTATPARNADLYWALKGGGNSFALVTRFTMQTHPSGTAGTITGAYPTYGTNQTRAFLDTLHAFALHGDADSRGAVEPAMRWQPSSGSFAPTCLTTMLYDGADTDPAVLANWTGSAHAATGGSVGVQPLEQKSAGPPLLQPTTLWDYTRALYNGSDLRTLGTRSRYIMFSTYADRATLGIVVDDFFAALNASLADVREINVNLVFQPWRRDFLAASRANGGAPMGYDVERGPYIWFVQSYSWPDPGDDERVEAFYADWTARMEERLKREGRMEPFVYMNDADRGQKVFEGYGAENVARLKEIRARYDPDMVFTKLMPGGWKVEDA